MSGTERQYTLAELNSNVPVINSIIREADKWIAFGTNDGKREISSSWEQQAIATFKERVDVVRGILKNRKLAGEWAACRIALSKAKTFVEIKQAAEKLRK